MGLSPNQLRFKFGTVMEKSTDLVIHRRNGPISWIIFNHPKAVNPIGIASNLAIRTALADVNADPETDAIILTGGEGRSFCAGGDFNEVSSMEKKSDVEAWLDQTVALYEAVLSVNKPVICALDGFAIGIGFQLALCADWRVATPKSSLIMWELQKGIACVLGAAMLEHCFGRLPMTKIIYGCEAIDGQKALSLGLIDELADPVDLTHHATRTAQRFAAYPKEPFQKTKAIINSGMKSVLKGALVPGKDIHATCFAAGAATRHFQSILSK